MVTMDQVIGWPTRSIRVIYAVVKMVIIITRICAAEMAVRYAGPQCVPKSTSVTLAGPKDVTDGNDNGTDGQTDGQTDRQTDGQTECDA